MAAIWTIVLQIYVFMLHSFSSCL